MIDVLTTLALLDDGDFDNQLKGSIGEMTASHLLSGLDNTKYGCIHNILLPLKNGGTTQIDHLVLSPYGVFVIETKNYQGFIFGDEYQDYWTQKTYNGTYRLFNPIKQNNIHINTLANLLNINREFFHSIILFVGECEIKTTLPNYVMVCDFFANNLNAYINSKQNIIISPELFKQIISDLKNHIIKSTPQSEQQHRDYVKSRQNLCPKCGSNMVERMAKNTGKKFLGCIRFSQCCGTRPFNDIDNEQKEIYKLLKFLL